MFRYAEDKKIVSIIIMMTAIDVVAYLLLDNLWLLVAYWLLMFVPKGFVAPWNHHHQHCMTFRSSLLNRLYELSLALHTGMTTHSWVLHHVLGHHRNFQDQSKDESRWKRKSGRRMGVIEYTLIVSITAYYRAYRAGKRHPKQQRMFLGFSLLTLAVLVGLVFLRPLPALFIFVLPMICTLIYTSWVTYDHHAGLESEDQFASSYNIMNRWFNKMTGNLGYHTAHHHKPGVHWSRLPQLHEQIAERIPQELFVPSTFDFFLPNDRVEEPVIALQSETELPVIEAAAIEIAAIKKTT